MSGSRQEPLLFTRVKAAAHICLESAGTPSVLRACPLCPAHRGAASPSFRWDPGGGVRCWHGRGGCLWGEQDAHCAPCTVSAPLGLSAEPEDDGGVPSRAGGYTPAAPPSSCGPCFSAGSSRSKSKTLGSISLPPKRRGYRAQTSLGE